VQLLEEAPPEKAAQMLTRFIADIRSALDSAK
jgi:tryptophan synthase alpha chain